MRRNNLAALMVLAASSLGCSDDGGADTSSGGQGGSSGSGAAGAASGGAGANSMAGSGAVAGDSSSAGASGSAGSAGSGGFTMRGACGERGKATVTSTTFDGQEEFFIIGDNGFGEDICVVRFDVERVGEAPAGCVDEEGKACAWTHLVRYSNPSVTLDVDGVCANNEFPLDMARLEEIDGSEVAYGYVDEYAGHASVPMRRDASGTWNPHGLGNWDPETSMFRFDRRGPCRY